MNVVANELIGIEGYTLPELRIGGYKIVSTFSRPDEAALNAAVKQNVQQMAADGGALPKYARVGAELQDPQTGAILAIYGGARRDPPAAPCGPAGRPVNTPVDARRHAGSPLHPDVPCP